MAVLMTAQIPGGTVAGQVQYHPVERAAWGAKGRARVLAHYTQAQIAAATVALYRQVLTA